MTKNYGETKVLYRKGPRLNNKKKEHKKAPKKRSEKKNMENTHTRVMLKREVLLHKKCRKNPFITTLFCFFFSTNTHDDEDEDDFDDDDSYIYIFFFYQWTAWRAMSPFLPLGVKLTHFCARAKPSHRVAKRRSWNKRKSKDS